MANVLLRSPYHISEDIGSNKSAKLEITIDGTLAYTIIKNKTSSSLMCRSRILQVELQVLEYQLPERWIFFGNYCRIYC